MNHAERYLDLIARCPKQLDAQYRAAFYLLSAEKEVYEVAKEHVDVVGIDFAKIRKAAGSMGEKQMCVVQTAHSLFGSARSTTRIPTPYEISQLGAPLIGAVVTAMLICGEQAHVEVFTNAEGTPAFDIDTSNYYRNCRFNENLTKMAAEYAPAGEEDEDSLDR